MNIVQTPKKRPYDTLPIYDRPQLTNLSAQPYNTGISVGSAPAAQSWDAAKPATIGKKRGAA